MTNERAIELLHRISDSQFDGPHGDERREALDMAVRALVEPNIGQKTIDCIIKRLNDEDRNTDDLISRKQVLNASHFVACWDGVEHFSLEVVDADFIQKLPSVQPTQINTLDCVSRQAAIDTINALHEKLNAWLDSAVDAVMMLPSAQPQRKKGRWSKPFNMGTYKYQCSECEKLSRAMYDYCPSCGARMDEGESDE